MEKNMENEMEIGIIRGIIGIRASQKLRGSFLGVPIIRNVVVRGLYGVPPNWETTILGGTRSPPSTGPEPCKMQAGGCAMHLTSYSGACALRWVPICVYIMTRFETGLIKPQCPGEDTAALQLKLRSDPTTLNPKPLNPLP